MVTVTVLRRGLITAAWLLPSMVGGRQAWTDEMAKEYQDASMQFHNAQHHHASQQSHAHSGANGTGDVEATLEQARDAFLAKRAELQAAQNRGKGTALILWWAGIGCTTAGCALHYLHEQK